MAGEMEATALRDLLATTKDGDWGKDSPAEGLVPYRVIRGTDFPSVRHGDTSSVPIRYLNESTVHRRTLAEDDILLETAGGSPDRPTGRSLLINKKLIGSLDLPATCASFARFLRVDRNKAEPQYVYWFLQYLYATGQMEEHQVQHTGVARFQYTKFAESQRIPLPPRYEQRAIAHILGTLDDKIELNRRMNETLEAMARALFKSWFVDFDPVRAKAEGRDPGLPKPLADLFPTRLVDSELGEIPEGWEVAPLPEVVDVNPTRALRKGVEAPYLDMANMPTRGHSADEVVDRAFGSGMRFIKGDTLVARITPCLENGKTAFVDFLQEGQVGWGSTEYIVLRPKAPLPEEYAYCLARSAEFREFAIQSMTGTSGRQRVPAESLAHFRVAVPSRPIAEAFGRSVKPRFARASAAVRESRTLAALRDALLPKLVSGQLRVKAGARVVMETAA